MSNRTDLNGMLELLGGLAYVPLDLLAYHALLTLLWGKDIQGPMTVEGVATAPRPEAPCVHVPACDTSRVSRADNAFIAAEANSS